MMAEPSIRFAVIGINHNHIFGQINLLLNAGAEFVSFFAPEADLAERFGSLFSDIRQARSTAEILEDAAIDLVVSAGIPCDRAPLGIQVMRHGKDYMTDKPGFTTLDQLADVRRVQAETGRIYSICFSERLESRATVKAGELVAAGAIGKVVQTVGLGPHRIDVAARPEWFFQKAKYGGILTDIASHQADQFLYFTGSTEAEVLTAQVANYKFPEHLELEDYGEMLLRGNGGSGYVRVDWYTPQGLPVWGDGRLTILGTEGYIELRKYIDIAGRPGSDHLFLVNQDDMQYIDCSVVDLPYGRLLVQDVLNRTETAVPQAHVFLASQLVLTAEAQAERLGNLRHE
jgi:predicted dehydrogenase